MKAYLDIVKNILNTGVEKQPVRRDLNGNSVPVENSTIGTFCEIFRHDMSEGFPLLTCRKLPFKNTMVELEGFIKGITSKQWFKDRKCPYWNYWASPKAVRRAMNERWSYDDSMTEDEANADYRATEKVIQAELDDLGPLGYSWQWRNFDQSYNGSDGASSGVDQLKTIITQLKKNPYDRRMLCSGWNPNQLHLMALPPCHVMWNVVVYGDKLNLCWYQRSNDVLIGSPANISSYAALLMLLAKTANLVPGELVGVMADAHIYTNQLEQAKEVIERTPKTLPELVIKDDNFDIFNWTHEDVELVGYNPHPAIKMNLTI